MRPVQRSAAVSFSTSYITYSYKKIIATSIHSMKAFFNLRLVIVWLQDLTESCSESFENHEFLCQTPRERIEQRNFFPESFFVKLNFSCDSSFDM